MRVLDLGSGTGYPALLAGEVVGSEGSVVGIDLADSMLAVVSARHTLLAGNEISAQGYLTRSNTNTFGTSFPALLSIQV